MALTEVIVEAAIRKLTDESLKRVADALKIEPEMKKLLKSLFQIQALLVDASQKEIKEVLVQKWLDAVRHLAYDIEDILDDLANEAMHLDLTKQSRSTTSKVSKFVSKFSPATSMERKLHSISIKLQDLENERIAIGLVKTGLIVKNGKRNNKIQTTSLVDSSRIVGREGEKNALLYKLFADEQLDANFSIVPIVGMGGVGKTTLAKLLYNDEQVIMHFESRAWISVSDEWDTFRMSNILFQSVAGETKEFKDLNLLQVALGDRLRQKRFLLVLDDVWSESIDDWETLLAPFRACARGSKIIVTTRKENLLRQLGCKPDHLQSLSHDDAMCLFAQHALGENNYYSHPKLKVPGEGIVRKCGGLPLALIAIGRLLRTKQNEVEWKEIEDREIWSLDEGGQIIPALRLSYDELPAHLKQLFAYCSLFPKDCAFDKQDLVLLWMAEGFLHQSPRNMLSEERLGHEYFQELLSRSFFQHAHNDESLFIMHDLMNDLAMSVAGDFFFRLDNEIENDVRKEALEKYRHMSFVCNTYETYEKFKVFERATSLRTFLSASVGARGWGNYMYFSSKILVDILPKLPLLRVIRLSGYEIHEVPESIGSLKNLRYLNLSQTKITHLPETVCDLYNLQTLILFGCSYLTKLPMGVSKLKNLRHLDIRDTPRLSDVPLGIDEMKGLKTLSKLIIGGKNDFSITQLRDVNISQKTLTALEVEWSNVSYGSRKETSEKEVLDVLRPCENLKNLGIVNYWGLTFPKWVGDPSFRWLARVSIRGCKKCTFLPPLGQLQSLKELSIQDIDDVKVIGSELLGTGFAFPSLEILSFEGMSEWEVWSTNNSRGVEEFPCLRKLSIRGCRKLVEVSLDVLPSLRELQINSCGNDVLKSLVHVAPGVTKLEIKSISGLNDETWRGVMWDLKAVEEVKIKSCAEISYLWESQAEANKLLRNLRKLQVSECRNLVSLGEKDEDNDDGSYFLTPLRSLEVHCCENLKRCSCPNNIELLEISYCSSITCVSFSTGGHQELKSISIQGCKKLLFKQLGGEKSMPLEYVYVSSLLNLASIGGLGNFIHLTTLKIEDCRSTESFPDLQLLLQSLTSLIHLVIRRCPSIDPPGVWPPKLHYLNTGSLKKPISEWGPQIFPASLVDLTLAGTPAEEEATSSSQLSHLLPSSLISLKIFDFHNLELLSNGLEHLTSLKHLHIFNCPEVKNLPVMLLPSLLTLYISLCPNLKENCSRNERGSYYWPLISHIPCIKIN